MWGREKSRESSTLAPSLAIHGEFASRLNVLKWSSGCLNTIANYWIVFIYEIFGPGKTSKSCFRRQFWRTAYKADRDHAGQTFFTVILKVPGLPTIWFHLRSFLSFCFFSCIPSRFLIFVPESGHIHNFLNFFLQFRATTLHGGRNQEQRWGWDVTSSFYFVVMVVKCLFCKSRETPRV